jgi:hypothetical protein
MKDHRFIELVNLYVDRQITAAETAELEAEIQSNPRRRAIYRQYCRMHRATKLVFESFRANAPEQAAVAAAGQGTIARFERERRTHWGYYAAAFAAAACLALVFVQLNSRKAAEAGLLAKAETLPPVKVVTAAPRPVAAPVAADPKAVPGSLRSKAAAEQDYAAMLAVLRQEEQRAFASDAVQTGRLPSLFDDGVFEPQQVLPLNNPRVFRSKYAPAQPADAKAVSFQFQR